MEEVQSILDKMETLQNRITLLEEVSSRHPATKQQILVMVMCLMLITVASLCLVIITAVSSSNIQQSIQEIYSLLVSV